MNDIVSGKVMVASDNYFYLVSKYKKSVWTIEPKSGDQWITDIMLIPDDKSINGAYRVECGRIL